jgi:6-phosphofructokinase 1
MESIDRRNERGKGFVNIVIAEGAMPKGGKQIGQEAKIHGGNFRLGGIGVYLQQQLEERHCPLDIRTTILGHIQRGGTPIAFDRVLATSMGVRAFKMICEEDFGKMVAYKDYKLVSVPLAEAIAKTKTVPTDHYMIETARSLGISFGD